MQIWDLAKPVIAQVHGYCLAGGSELATGCDLVYVAEDAQMGYPAVRFGVPDMHFHAWLLGMRTAMEMMVTGDSITGVEAVEHGLGQPGVPRGRARRRRCSPSPTASPRCRPTSSSSTSGSCTAAWRSWACAPPSAPAPSCAPSAPTSRSMHDFVREHDREGPHRRPRRARRPFGDYRTAEVQPSAPPDAVRASRTRGPGRRR